MNSNIIFNILKISNIFLLIINLLKLRKYILFNNITYSDNGSMSFTKNHLLVHVISFQLLILILIFKLSKLYFICFFISLYNFYIILFNNYKYHLGANSICVSVIGNTISLMLILLLSLLLNFSNNQNIINLILLILSIPSFAILYTDIINFNYLFNPSYNTNSVQTIQKKCPFAFLDNFINNFI